MLKLKKTTILWAVFLFFAAQSFAAEIIIDTFASPTSQATYSSSSKTQVQWTDSSSSGDILGGVRDGSVGCELSTDNNQSQARVGDGTFAITAQPKAGPSTYLSYDGTEGWSQPADPENDRFNGTFASAIDLTDGRLNDRFYFSFVYAFHGKDGDGTVTFNDFRITLLEYDNGENNTYSYNVGYQGDGSANTWMTENYTDLNDGESATFAMDFSSFGDASLDDVLALQIHICSADLGSDYTLNSISAAVPEPTSIAMISVTGAIALIIRRRFCS